MYVCLFIPRSIRRHEEITLQYNLLANGLLDVCDVVGGCFQSHQCFCGCKFCVGDILRRLHHGISEPDDVLFFILDNQEGLFVDMGLVYKANECYVSQRTGDDDVDVSYVLDMIRAIRAERGQDLGSSVSMLQDRFNTYVSPSAYAPTHRSVFHV